MCRCLQVNLIGYDYTGYGASTGGLSTAAALTSASRRADAILLFPDLTILLYCECRMLRCNPSSVHACLLCVFLAVDITAPPDRRVRPHIQQLRTTVLPAGLPSVSNSFADIEAVYDHLVKQHSVRPDSIILYGQSVGSGPTMHLAARPGIEVAGVVLHTPILSGIRVLNPKLRWWPASLDVFHNHLLAPKVRPSRQLPRTMAG